MEIFFCFRRGQEIHRFGPFLLWRQMSQFDVGDILIGMMLEKFMTGRRTAQAAQHAELAVMNVRDCGAIVLTLRPGVETDNVGEENTGELGV